MDFNSATDFLRGHCGSDDRLLLAVSGGADSLAMLLLLSEDGEFRDRVVCATVDHGLRESSADDVEFVREICAARGIQFDAQIVDTQGEIREHKRSLEAAARRVRYRALEEMRVRNQCQWILTAHTLDDDAETVLMKVRANSSWYECTGIPQKRGAIVRPFLDVPRHELRSVIDRSGVLPREDQHNLDKRFPRVRVRLRLAALPTEARKQTVVAAATQGRQVGELLKAIRRLSRVVLQGHRKQYVTEVSEIDIDNGISYLNSLGFMPIESVIAELLDVRDFRLSASSRRRAVQFARGRQVQATLVLPEGLELQRRGRSLRVISTVNTDAVQIPSTIATEFHLAKAQLHGTLILREWRAGDRFKPAKRRTRKVSDWLRDSGIPSESRARVRVVCDDLGIVAIPGLGIAERVCPRASEETVRISCVD